MVLPLLATAGRQFLMSSAKNFAKSSAKKAIKNKIKPKKKKIKSEKFFGKDEKGGALSKTEKEKSNFQPSGALVKYQSPTLKVDKLLDLKPEEKKGSIGEELQSVIDEVKKLRSGLVQIKGLLDERKNSELKSLVESKKQIQIDKKKRREGELESKKQPKKEKGGISIPKPKFSFFDSITNFFTSVLIGSLLNFLLANKDKIFKAFEDISKGFTNIFDVMRFSIISLTTAMPKLVKTVAKLGAKVFAGPAKLTGNLLKKLGGSIKNLLVKVGKSLSGFVSNTFRSLTGVGAGASGATRATGVQQRRFKGKGAGAKTKLRQLPKPGTPKPTSAATIKNAEKLFTRGGLKHFKKVSSVFKRIPFIGALIGIGIDLAMGERLDNAIAGAAGASLGAAIGGAIGTAAIPIPFVGTFLGGTIGAAVGDWAGKEIYKNLSGQITQINPPITEEKPDTPPTPPSTPGTGARGGQVTTVQGMVSGGNADFWTLAAIASLESGNPQGQADVAQSIYNRLASGVYSGNTIKELINAKKQYSPVGESDPSKWAAIVDEATAIAAVASHKNGGVNAARMVSGAAKNINNPSLQKNAAQWVGGRTDFTVPSKMHVHQYRSANLSKEISRHGHVFGWFVGPGAASYGQSNPGPAGVPNLGDASTPTSSTPLIKQSQLPPLPPTGIDPTYGAAQMYGAARRGGRKHAGVDFDAGPNDTFYSRIGGRVIYSANAGGGYGNVVDVYNSELGVTERIAEGDVNLVKVGDVIRPGTPVQKGTHQTGVFHYEIRKGKAGASGSFAGTLDPTKFLASLDQKGGVSATTQAQSIRQQASLDQKGGVSATTQAQSIRQQASYDQRGGTVVVPAPVVGGGGGQVMSGGGSGGVLPIGMLQKDVLNSYYRAQLLGFLYKQG